METVAKKLHGRSIDLLINNAGILSNETLDEIDFAGIRQQFEVNAIGPLRVATALLGNLKSGSRIAMLTSRMGSMADNSSGAYYGYRMSKAALNAAAKSLAIDLRDRGIAVGIFHPGYVKTRMTGFNGDVEAGDAARRLFDRIEELNLENSGRFVHANGEPLPW